MFDEYTGVYTIGTAAKFIGEHPETLRVWERKGLIQPNRQGYQRRYSNEDLKRLKFIKYLIDEKGLNIAGVKHIISMYPCWTKKNCKGGARKNSPVPINETKPCWKLEGTYCMIALDKAEVCNTCEFYRNCTNCDGCRNS